MQAELTATHHCNTHIKCDVDGAVCNKLYEGYPCLAMLQFLACGAATIIQTWVREVAFKECT